MDFHEKMSNIMDSLSTRQDTTTIFEHYGVKEEEFQKWIQEILIDLIRHPSYNDSLDKWFKELSGEGRVKVFCFCEAIIRHKKLMI